MGAKTAVREDITFTSNEVVCGAWHYTATSEALTTAAGRPCVVMAHGFGGTRDSGLEGFAEAFAEAGVDTLLFDYRSFGASGGEPRQVVDIEGQLADYGAAIERARTLDGVDPDRIVVWGVSLSGGHVFRLAARDQRLAAAIALTPATDGRATALAGIKRNGVAASLKQLPAGVVGAVAAAKSKQPLYMPIVTPQDTGGAVSAPGSFAAYTDIAGPTWENRYRLADPLSILRYRPGKDAAKISCPVLVQVADLDQSAPPLRVAEDAKPLRKAEVRHYPCDHFDVYAGREWFGQVVRHQVDFLTRRLSS